MMPINCLNEIFMYLKIDSSFLCLLRIRVVRGIHIIFSYLEEKCLFLALKYLHQAVHRQKIYQHHHTHQKKVSYLSCKRFFSHPQNHALLLYEEESQLRYEHV